MTGQPYMLTLDPGHGGANKGCRGNGVIEEDWTIAFCRMFARMVRNSSLPFDAQLTRVGDDETVSFDRRGKRSHGSDLVYCVHVNAGASERWHGLETYVWPGNELGMGIARTISRCAPKPLYHPGKQPFVCTEPTPDPTDGDDWIENPRNVIGCHASTAILIEVGFCSNVFDAAALLNEDTQRGIGFAMAQGLTQFLTQRGRP